MPFFSDLVTGTDEARRSFETHPAVLDGMAHGMTLERYRRFLLELYPIVLHFCPVAAAAASRMPDSLYDVRMHLYKHVHEESGHERWVLNDLEALSVTGDICRANQPMPDTLALIGYNYWAADRLHPCSVLGMIYVLEVIASVYGGPFADSLREALLLEGDRGVSFISSHATIDTQHMSELRDVLNTVDDEFARKAVIESTTVNFNHVTRIFAAV